jgi:hypothetical protein
LIQLVRSFASRTAFSMYAFSLCFKLVISSSSETAAGHTPRSAW